MSQIDQRQQNENPLFSTREVGKRLSIARELMHISLEKMARGLTTSTATIKRVEQGRLPLPDHWLPTLATTFKIDTHWLATGHRPVAAAAARALDLMQNIMHVPEVNGFINFQFQVSKHIFKDPIKKRIIPWRNI